jgi:hypothetical protein
MFYGFESKYWREYASPYSIKDAVDLVLNFFLPQPAFFVAIAL